ncbi:Hypothetical protein PHPALM_14203 [Phytophthora palmivora]|uniref:CCHC-type domain-containing protein n=1 Tax=Phytophthora palmivora TaxID=4796 RepID=A0A2P4XVC8_9STRA|nr:Hypothetical protein PHPALM_14203 [Phytophthora palmivora]
MLLRILRTVLMAKVDNTGTDYLTHAKELAHFAQAWEIEAKRKPRSGASWSSRNETRRYHKCGQVGHLRAACPHKEEQQEPDITLATWLEDLTPHVDSCTQSNGEPLTITMKGTLTLRVKACGIQQILKLTNVYYSEDVTFNLL